MNRWAHIPKEKIKPSSLFASCWVSCTTSNIQSCTKTSKYVFNYDSIKCWLNFTNWVVTVLKIHVMLLWTVLSEFKNTFPFSKCSQIPPQSPLREQWSRRKGFVGLFVLILISAVPRLFLCHKITRWLMFSLKEKAFWTLFPLFNTGTGIFLDNPIHTHQMLAIISNDSKM